MTFGDYIQQLREEGARTGKDLAYAVLWRREDGQHNVPVECKVEWLAPGAFPKLFPDQGDTEPNQFWDKGWTILRCTEQPKREVISLRPGQFLDAMPDIKF